MSDKDSMNSNTKVSVPKGRVKTSSHIVTADSAQAEEVPTIPLGSIQSLSTLQPEVAVRSVATTKAVSIPAPLVVQPAEYQRGLAEWVRIWLDGIRPIYLPLSLMPVLLGSALAWAGTVSQANAFGHFHILRFLAAVAAVLLLQTGAHLVNDYYDYLRGIDTSNTLGPGKLIQQGLIKPARVLAFGLATLGLGVLLGGLAAISGSWPVLLFGLIGLLCAFFYSASKRALSSLMLGEVVAFCIYGPLITIGAYMLQTGLFSRTALLYSVPLGLLAAAAVHANNMRDAEGDAHAGKHTLASALGLSLSRALYLVLLVGAYAIITALGIPRNAPHLVLITLWTLPVAAVVVTGVLRTDTPPGLNLVMRQTLKLETFFALLLIAALTISAMLPVLFHLPSIVLPI